MANASLVSINEIDFDTLCNTWLTIHQNQSLDDLVHTKKIRVWLQEKEVQVEKCTDYLSRKLKNDMKSCWVCKWLAWLIDTNYAVGQESIVRQDHHEALSSVED